MSLDALNFAVFEDSDSDYKILCRAFSKALIPCELVRFCLASEGLQRLQAGPARFDAALVDLGLPDMPGETLIKLLVDNGHFDISNIYILTGLPQSYRIQSLLKSQQAGGFLDKDCSAEDISMFIKNFLDIK